ncbi:hypothetical protein ISCGN_016507 [Ixodes scapularis]
MGPFNCFTVQPCFIVAVYAIAVCNARRFSFHVRHRQLPPEIILLFGGFKPSQGHGVRMCKVLSSEWHRQARFYKECLFLMLQGTTSNGHGGRRWREYRELADATAEFHWRRMLSELRASAPKRAAPSRSTVHTLGQVSLPESIRRVLDRGPKFGVEPKKSRAELLSLVRDVARKVPEVEAGRCDVDVLFSAPDKLSRLCRAVNPSSRAATACSTRHRDRFVRCSEGVVYSLPLTCGRRYVGQTGRCLNDRLREHAYSVSTTVSGHLGIHCRDCGCLPDFQRCKVVKRHRDQLTREILEAVEIARLGAARVSSPSVALSGKEMNFLVP